LEKKLFFWLKSGILTVARDMIQQRLQAENIQHC